MKVLHEGKRDFTDDRKQRRGTEGREAGGTEAGRELPLTEMVKTLEGADWWGLEESGDQELSLGCFK